MTLPRIDADAMVVRDGDRALPFEAVVAQGSAVLDPGGAAVTVRLLGWSEKCALARFAGQGGAFLERQLLLACAPGVQAADHDAAVALAMWLHAPEGDALPFDAALLARVTAGLCERLGQGPAELARLPAPEVEALWRAMAEQPGVTAAPAHAAAPPPERTTRIVIEPDPESPEEYGTADQGAAPALRPTSAQPVSALPRMVPARDVPEAAPFAEQPVVGAFDAPQATASAAEYAAPAPALADREVARVTPIALATAPRAPGRPRFRLPGRPVAPAAAAEPTPVDAAAPVPLCTSREPSAASSPLTNTPQIEPLIARIARREAAPARIDVPPAADPIADPQLARLIALVSRHAERLEPEPEADPELLAERFASGLAEAAATLGIARAR